MRKLKVTIETSMHNSQCEDEFEIESDMTFEEAEEVATETAFDMVDWEWERIGNVIKVNISTSVITSRCDDEFEIDESMTEEDIEKAARDCAFNMISWCWEIVEPA